MEVLPVFITDYKLARVSLNLDTAAQNALAVGMMTERELQCWQQSLQQIDAEGTFFAHLNMILVVGRKPRQEYTPFLMF